MAQKLQLRQNTRRLPGGTGSRDTDKVIMGTFGAGRVRRWRQRKRKKSRESYDSLVTANGNTPDDGVVNLARLAVWKPNSVSLRKRCLFEK
ncbi:hypothetical protein BaRGS_00013275 [Batillaria attramentaria]|uniref:Uncharacterized protein n=1 Tax=Batillaria attramentaria TaxID=370345 RepID=A0ABD0L898_9CAEN